MSHDLGLLGRVDHFSNSKPEIGVGQRGRAYFVVESQVVNGTVKERPLDDRLYDSVYEARAAARIARANKALAS